MTRTRRAAPSAAPDPETAARAREDRKRRAREEPLDIRERSDRPFPTFEVRNPIHSTHYRVLAPPVSAAERLLLCPCPDFGRRDVGTCKHVEAVRTFLAAPHDPPEHPFHGAPTEPIWADVEAAQRRLPPLPLRDLRPVEAIGRRLIGVGGPDGAGTAGASARS